MIISERGHSDSCKDNARGATDTMIIINHILNLGVVLLFLSLINNANIILENDMREV